MATSKTSHCVHGIPSNPKDRFFLYGGGGGCGFHQRCCTHLDRRIRNALPANLFFRVSVVCLCMWMCHGMVWRAARASDATAWSILAVPRASAPLSMPIAVTTVGATRESTAQAVL